MLPRRVLPLLPRRLELGLGVVADRDRLAQALLELADHLLQLRLPLTQLLALLQHARQLAILVAAQLRLLREALLQLLALLLRGSKPLTQLIIGGAARTGLHVVSFR